MRTRHWAFGMVAAVGGSMAGPVLPAAAAVTPTQVVSAVDATATTVLAVTPVGDPDAVVVSSSPIAGFPMAGSDYLVLSTGRAAVLPGSPSTFLSTNLPSAAASADGNDLTQVRLQLRPPAGSSCLGVDFAFLSEEYPDYVGSRFNDVFTAELNESSFSLVNDQVVAPNNFAYDSKGNAVSINTVFGMTPASGTAMNGSTPVLSATTPVEKKLDGTMDLILSIQDLGDSIYDSAVLVDNLRWLSGVTCTGGIVELTDSDGDGLSDVWETKGIDYDEDGTPELDLPAMGADPKHKDLFLEVDWMDKPSTCVWFICWGGENFAPQQAALADVRAAFAGSPMTNPDGSTGVRVHIDSGPSSVMNPVTGATWGSRSRAGKVAHVESLGTINAGSYDWSAFDSVKSTNFDVLRKDAFHYVLYADTYAGSGSSGISRGIPGSDLLVTDGASGWGGGFTRTQERGTFMHELGHNLDLYHGGGPTGTSNYDTAYRSIMNYSYQLTGLPPGAGLDYSRGAPYVDWSNIRFDGGSVGDLGDSAPPPMLTVPDSLDAETAREKDVFAKDGDGDARFVGPTVLVPGTGTQQLHVDVRNAGGATDTFTVRATSPVAAVGGHASVSVPPGATVRITLPVDTKALGAPGDVPVTLTLSSTLAGDGLSGFGGVVTVPDMNDPAVRAAAAAARGELVALPSSAGLDQQVRTQLVAMLAPLWDATLTMRGTVGLQQTLKVLPPTITPSVDKPTSLAVASAPGAPTTTLDLVKTPGPGQPAAYSGQLVVTVGSAVTTYTVRGSWSARTSTFTGSYTGARGGGSVVLKLTKPAGG